MRRFFLDQPSHHRSGRPEGGWPAAGPMGVAPMRIGARAGGESVSDNVLSIGHTRKFVTMDNIVLPDGTHIII